jgi:DNA-binding XRE family transcriptional regulator
MYQSEIDEDTMQYVILQEDTNQYIISQEDAELEIEYVASMQLLDPYKMNPHLVHISHFQSAFLYDPEAEPGFKVSRSVAKQKYNQYKQRIRSKEGWKNYRKPPHIIYEEVKEGNRIGIIKRTVYMKVPGSLLPEFTIEKVLTVPRGAAFIRLPKEDLKKDYQIEAEATNPLEADDKTSVAPKMFTLHMGREIARLRNELHLTQAELAMIVNVDANYIKNVEIGDLITFNPEDVIVRKLARALGIFAIKYHE